MSKPGTVKIIYALNEKKVILSVAFITDDLYWHWSSGWGIMWININRDGNTHLSQIRSNCIFLDF